MVDVVLDISGVRVRDEVLPSQKRAPSVNLGTLVVGVKSRDLGTFRFLPILLEVPFAAIVDFV